MRGFIVCVVLTVITGSALAENWPQWRGPRGNGVSVETGLPVRWGDEENVAWTAQLSGLSVSTPVIHGRSSVRHRASRTRRPPGGEPSDVDARRGKAPPSDPSERATAAAEGDVEFLVEAFDRESGRRLWQYRLAGGDAGGGELPPVHRKHNLASPSPVTDGERVYAWFGTGQLVALDFEGKLVWQKHLGEGLRSLRDSLGPFELPHGLRRRSSFFSATTSPRRTFSLSTSEPARRSGRPIAARDSAPTARPRWFLGPRGRAGGELEREARGLRPEDREAPLVPGRAEPVPDSRALVRRRHHLYEPRLPERSLHGDSSGRPRRPEGVGASSLARADGSSLRLVRRPLPGRGLHGERRRSGAGGRRGDGRAALSGQDRRRFLGGTGRGRREGLLRERDRRGDRPRGQAGVRDSRAEHDERAVSRVPRHLRRPDFPPERRSVDRDRRSLRERRLGPVGAKTAEEASKFLDNANAVVNLRHSMAASRFDRRASDRKPSSREPGGGEPGLQDPRGALSRSSASSSPPRAAAPTGWRTSSPGWGRGSSSRFCS